MWLPQLVWGLFLDSYFCWQDNDARYTFRADFIAIIPDNLTQLIIHCDMTAGNMLMQSCLKIGTIATVPVHNVLPHETMLQELKRLWKCIWRYIEQLVG